MNIRYHWSSSPTAALSSHGRLPCFHLALVTHHLVILLVLSLSLSLCLPPPSRPTHISLQALSPETQSAPGY